MVDAGYALVVYSREGDEEVRSTLFEMLNRLSCDSDHPYQYMMGLIVGKRSCEPAKSKVIANRLR